MVEIKAPYETKRIIVGAESLALFERFRHFRPLRHSQVVRLKKALLANPAIAGMLVLNNKGTPANPDYTVIDGTHRLQAVKELVIDGDVLQFSIPEDRLRAAAQFPTRSLRETVADWEARKLIVGYVPILSDGGRKYLAGLGSVSAPFRTEGTTTPAGQGTDDCPFCREPIASHAKVSCALKPREVETKL
jgi:hypothetical protein